MQNAQRPKFRAITMQNVAATPQWEKFAPEMREAVRVVSSVLPFRTNQYVMDELIDWDAVPNDPMFQLTFPQRGMLAERDYQTVARLLASDAPREELSAAVSDIRMSLNPHPAGQMTHNVPTWRGQSLPGLQHKYPETVLFFPRQGQTCHAYCTFCFRWPQFVGMDDLKFSNDEVTQLVGYVTDHTEVTDVLFTGGDPLVMSAANLRRYIEPLLHPSLDRVQTIRIGTKSLAYWPHRFVFDSDADELLRLFSDVIAAGRHLSIMGHYSHPVEFSTPVAREAVRRIRATGAVIRMQSPVIKHVNDSSETWAELWRTGVRLGCIPYYMFVERDTGAKAYFEIPLARCWDIFRNAYNSVSGLARTVRGPSMSALPGKVHILGVAEETGSAKRVTPGRPTPRVFVLQYLQSRKPELVRRPFFAKFNPRATWFDQLEPAGPADREFFDLPEPRDALHLPVYVPRQRQPLRSLGDAVA